MAIWWDRPRPARGILFKVRTETEREVAIWEDSGNLMTFHGMADKVAIASPLGMGHRELGTSTNDRPNESKGSPPKSKYPIHRKFKDPPNVIAPLLALNHTWGNASGG